MSVYKRGAVWRAEIRSNRAGEKPFRMVRTFDTKSEATAFERSQRIALSDARRIGRTMPESITVAEALDKWWNEASKSLSESYRSTNYYRKRAWQNTYFSDLPVAELTIQHLEGWVQDERERGMSESTLRNCIFVLRSLFKHARRKWKWAIVDPTSEVLAEIGTSNCRDRRLSVQEHQRLVKLFSLLRQRQLESSKMLATDPTARITIRRSEIVIDEQPDRSISMPYHDSLLYISAAFETAIEAAMRRGKMFEIRWSWVDWTSRMVLIPPGSQGPSNKRAPAKLPMSPSLVRSLKNLNGVSDDGKIIRKVGDDAEAKVFGALTADRAYRLLRIACELLDIKDLHWHDLRHEACSRLAELGWTIQQIQMVSGHKTLQSLQRYMHIRAEMIHRLWDGQPQAQAA